MKRILIVGVMAIVLSSCMDNSMASNSWPWRVDSVGEWTLTIEAQYADGSSTHYVSGEGEEGFDLAPIIGTEQLSWSATMNKDASVQTWYKGTEVYNGLLPQGETISR